MFCARSTAEPFPGRIRAGRAACSLVHLCPTIESHAQLGDRNQSRAPELTKPANNAVIGGQRRWRSEPPPPPLLQHEKRRASRIPLGETTGCDSFATLYKCDRGVHMEIISRSRKMPAKRMPRGARAAKREEVHQRDRSSIGRQRRGRVLSLSSSNTLLSLFFTSPSPVPSKTGDSEPRPTLWHSRIEREHETWRNAESDWTERAAAARPPPPPPPFRSDVSLSLSPPSEVEEAQRPRWAAAASISRSCSWSSDEHAQKPCGGKIVPGVRGNKKEKKVVKAKDEIFIFFSPFSTSSSTRRR